MADDRTDNIVVMMDLVGRTILGERVSETETTLKIKNPAVVNVTPVQEGNQVRMTLQLFPLFFREFLGDKGEEMVWTYNKNNITLPEKAPVLDFKMAIQYKQLFMNQPTPVQTNTNTQPQPTNKLEPIKLFDDK